MYSAFNFPEDFDGIVAGSPATNFDNLLGASGMWTTFFGQNTDNNSFINEEQWMLVLNETMRQCDGIDGVMDGIITEPDACDFRPEEIQCGRNSTNSSSCLTKGQVAGLKQLYSPLYGLGGKWLFPAYNLGADAVTEFEAIFNTALFSYTEVGRPLLSFLMNDLTDALLDKDWVKFVVLNDSNYNISTFGLGTVAQIDALDPFNVSTWNGDFTPFMDKGGKIISYHGRADPVRSSATFSCPAF